MAAAAAAASRHRTNRKRPAARRLISLRRTAADAASVAVATFADLAFAVAVASGVAASGCFAVTNIDSRLANALASRHATLAGLCATRCRRVVAGGHSPIDHSTRLEFVAAFEKAEASGGCTVTGDAVDVGATLGECVATVVEDIARRCGDGVLVAAEDCDDGDLDSGDGCSAACEPEAGFDCDGEPSVCASTCADGVVASDEECDDGNATPGDGCDDGCVEEAGWECSQASGASACAAVCGDGLVRGDEECDDDNTDPGDGCDASCTGEPGWDCSGEPTACECDIDVVVTPGSGLRLPQNLTVSAAGTVTGCGLPLRYFWDCSSPNSSACPAILDAANAGGNTTASFVLPLGPAELYNISLVVCLEGTSQCAPPVTRQYAGDEI